EETTTVFVPETTIPKTTTTVTTTTTLTERPVLPVPDDMPVNNYTALNHEETKGVWISYFELYPILTGKSEEQFRNGIGEYYDNALSLGLNTVYVHVRPYGDAIYRSNYYPWSKYCTGYIGVDPGYDPLEVMIEEAHKRNISFHAWVNPMRCSQENDAPQIDDSYLVKEWYNYKDGDYISKVSGYWYLNPAYDEVTNLIALGVAEIVSRYDVDGVHIDDYFYPTKETWFDDISFDNSGYDDLAQFRLDNCTKMVYKMYEAVKSHNSTALFGVSAQGNVHNNLYELYADVEKWSREEGYVDYMAPQIYYGFENGGQPYAQVVDQWDEMLRGTGKKLIPGLAVYKIGTEDTWAGSGKYEWMENTEIIKRQIEKARTADNYSGIILYSYQFIFSPESDVESAVNAEIEAFKPLLT
ncbi:MAG: family 10 glycosylhydrolase, partial [Ruminiclostridium sp.]|nr:family 10 glycosylhydrolase [Ruminiclostridium sp.]